MDSEWLPVVKSWRLNERYYGALQGLNKSETAAKYGEEQVKIWRRSFDVRPPLLESHDERNPAGQRAYQEVPKNELPLAESLKDTITRVIPYFESEIKPLLQEGKKVLIGRARKLFARTHHVSGKSVGTRDRRGESPDRVSHSSTV